MDSNAATDAKIAPKIGELIGMKIIKNFETDSAPHATTSPEAVALKKNMNPFLNEGLASYLSQMLSDELMLQMAFKTPHVDNRFFRSEPVSTRQKLKKILPAPMQAKQRNVSIYEDRDYGLTFEVVDGLVKNFGVESAKTANKHSKTLKKFYANKSLHEMCAKLQNELNSLIVSEHFLVDRPKVNVWSSYDVGLDEDLDESDYEESSNVKDTVTATKTTKKMHDLKQKVKSDFIERNELLILNLADKMCKLDVDEFVRLNGMEILLFLYEKYKYDEYFLNVIGNCLCLISLDTTRRTLFIQSGWLKRLNQMCNTSGDEVASLPEHVSKKARENILMIREMIAHKVS